MTDRPTNCIICDKPIEQARMGPARTTCSVNCRVALYRQRHPESVHLYIGPGIAATLTAGNPVTEGGRGDRYLLAMDQALWVLQNVLGVFTTRAERRRVWSIVERWATSEEPKAELRRRLDPMVTEALPRLRAIQQATREEA